MNTAEKTSKQIINEKLSEIVELYEDSGITEILNDLVAIGTWPQPEKPKGTKEEGIKSVVPIPDRKKQLKKLLEEVIKEFGGRKVGSLV